MKELYYISRNFTEFGGFSAAEVLDFKRRGMLRSTDYVRLHNTDEWSHLKEWLDKNELPAMSPTPSKPKTPAAKKATSKTKAIKIVKHKD